MILISFHGDASIKQKYLDRVKKHQELDNIIQGTGWDGTKGCAVGCTLENYSHTAYEKELGIPTWLAHVEDKFFEGMSKERAKIWPLQFLEAIPVGVNLEAVKTQFILYILNQSLTTFDHVAFPAVKAAIDQTIAYHSRVFESAAEAEAAARSARSAAWSAAAARSAARSAAEAAARSAAEAAYEKYADKLLQLLSEAK